MACGDLDYRRAEFVCQCGKLGAPSTNQEQRSYYYEVGRLSRSQAATHALSFSPPPAPNHALLDAIEAPRHLYLRHRRPLRHGRRLNDIGLDGTTAEPADLPVQAPIIVENRTGAGGTTGVPRCYAARRHPVVGPCADSPIIVDDWSRRSGGAPFAKRQTLGRVPPSPVRSSRCEDVFVGPLRREKDRDCRTARCRRQPEADAPVPRLLLLRCRTSQSSCLFALRTFSELEVAGTRESCFSPATARLGEAHDRPRLLEICALADWSCESCGVRFETSDHLRLSEHRRTVRAVRTLERLVSSGSGKCSICGRVKGRSAVPVSAGAVPPRRQLRAALKLEASYLASQAGSE